MALGKQPEADLEGGSDEPIFSEINITPLTDVFLVMLIIFMAWAAVAIREEQQRSQAKEEAVKVEKRSGIKVDLPSGSALEIDPSKLSLVVSISAQGEISVLNQNGQEQRVADADLDRVFATAFKAGKDTQVVIKADKGTSHGFVVSVMEKAKQAGLLRLAIQTRGK
ncbi:MAG TPA: biopolymer transporter ExbD [Kofleriaceae bacterium]|nr:biopolymer transporter ExbD [Kofleriaceae bacterium]